MTEAEARTKWCPMVRYPVWPGECSGGNEGAKCIASDCMMWQWATTPGQEQCGYGPAKGYCGLGRKP